MVNFSAFSKELLELAEIEARNLGHMILSSEHVLIAISKNEKTLAFKILEKYGIVTENLIHDIETTYIKVKSRGDEVIYSQQLRDLFSASLLISKMLKFPYVSYEHFLIAMFSQYDSIAYRILTEYGASKEEITEITIKNKGIYDSESKYIAYNDGVSDDIESYEMNGNQKRILNEIKTPLEKDTIHLKKYATDLTESAKNEELDVAVELDEEINRVFQILVRKTKNSPIIIGQPGVGKSALVSQIAIMTANGSLPKILGKRRVISLNIPLILSGAKYKGDLEERLYNILEDIKNNPSYIIFIDNFHLVSVIGLQESTVQASYIIKKALMDGTLQVIGACSTNDYKKYIEKDYSLFRRVQEVELQEPDDKKAYKILESCKKRFEDFHNVIITDEALKETLSLSRKYIKNKFLPDKAIDILDDVSARKRLEYSKKNEENEKVLVVDKDDISEIISKITEIPLDKVKEDESEKLIKLPEILSEEVIGQEDAVLLVSKAIQRARVGLKDENKPIGSFIFLGPTGVGKTELCKTIAKTLFDNEESFIRVDMSEYQEKHTVSKFIGSPPGYTGYNDGGQLTEKVKKRPYSVVLFDEIEKAHFDVYDILLQVLDEGHLTDSKGEKVSFKNTIIIMTSNVGQSTIKKEMNLGFSSSEKSREEVNTKKREEHYIAELKKNFRPEFLNRIDEIIVFNSLSKDNLRDIIKIMISKLQEKLEERDIKLNVEKSAMDLLIKKGYSTEYGARPMKRTIQKMIVDELTTKILKNEIVEKNEVRITADGEKVLFDII